jgi:hypothetical protein
MVPLFSPDQGAPRRACVYAAMLALFGGFVMIGAGPLGSGLSAQGSGEAAAEFKRMAGELSAARLSGGEENQARMEKALAYLDSVAISGLNAPGVLNLDGMNRGLAELTSHNSPVGENYRLVKLGGTPAAYAMVVNFGLSGPAAVRIYAGGAGRYAFAAKIDHFAQKDFFDSDLELATVSSGDPVFVTISGRSDDLETGMFSAWKFDGSRLILLWSSDLLQQSSYEPEENGFRLAYCSQEDEDRPSECLKMSRDLYRFQAGEWKRIESVVVPPQKSGAK